MRKGSRHKPATRAKIAAAIRLKWKHALTHGQVAENAGNGSAGRERSDRVGEQSHLQNLPRREP